MRSHSKAPWKMIPLEDGGFTLVAGEDDAPFGEVWGDESDEQQWPAKSNASLIIAAPDLLVALESIENDDGRIPAAIWKMRNDAIAKARGK